jgi:hypothetical protein
VGTVRPGDPSTGNTAATDQSAAGTGSTGNPENIGDSQPLPAVQASDDAAGLSQPAPEPERDDPWPERDDRWPGEPESAEDRLAGDRQEPGEDAAQPAAAEPVAAAKAAVPRKRRRRHSTRSPAGQPEPRVRATRIDLPALRRRRPRTGQPPKNPDAVVTAFARITVVPAVLMMAWLLVGLPLLLIGSFLPAPALLIAVPLAVVLLGAGLRTMPVIWPRALPGAPWLAGAAPRREPDGRAWWGLAGTVVVAAGFAWWQFRFNSESVIVTSGPGEYLQTGYWLAQHGSLPIPQSLASFGGAHPGLGFSSTGFFTQGTSVVPGLMSGLPLVLAGAFWVHGTPAAAAMGPIFGGLAVLAFGGLVGRLAGLQWAPAGALVLAFTLPELYTSRGPFSETALQVLLFGGLSLVVDALALSLARRTRGPAEASAPPASTRELPAAARGRARFGAGLPRGWPSPPWVLMGLAGLALGLTAVVRFDGLLDVLPAIPFIGLLVARRNKTWSPFCIGLLIGVIYGLADGYLLARPFVDSLQPRPELIGLIAAWLVAMTVAGVQLLQLPGFRKGLRPVLARRPVRWLPEIGGVLAAAALAALAVRPYLQTVRGPATGAAADLVASLQRMEHLPVDPGRLYAEDTLYWVIWYVGLPAVLLGGFGLALLVRRCLRALLTWQDQSGAARVWALPLAVICCGSAAVLWQPEIVPDQPWASRRLVPLVLPGLILCAVWASAWLRGRARSRGAGQTATAVVAACCVAALLVPTVATTFSLGLTHTGSNGAAQVSANGLALKRTGQGEVGAVNDLCSELGPSASVVIVDWPVAQQFTQVIRGMCGVPAAWMVGQPAGAVQSVLAGIEHAGRRPVLLAARPGQLLAYGGGSPVRVLDLSTTQDPQTLTQPPTAPVPVNYVIWMSSLSSAGTRV